MSNWSNPRWNSLTGPDADALRQIFESLSRFLENPTFNSGVALGDGSTPTYDPVADVVVQPDSTPVDSGTIGDINTNLAQLQTDLDAAEAAVAAAQADVDTLETVTIPALDIRLDTAEADIAAAQVEIDGILPISETDITDGAISTPKLAANAVTADKIAANTITAAQIAADAITADELAADSVTANELAAGAVTAGKIAAGTVTATEIAAHSITANEIAADTITANELAALEIEVSKHIQSSDYDGTDVATGDATTGWRVEGDGAAEFNDVRVRGEVTATEFHGADTVSIIPNGGFETDTAGWSSYLSGVLTRTTTTVRTGTGALQVASSGAAGTRGASVSVTAAPGDVLHFQAYACKESLDPDNDLNLVTVTAFAYSGGVFQRSESLGSTLPLGAPFWTLIERYWVVPSDTASPVDEVRFAIYSYAGSASLRLYVDDVVVGHAANIVVPALITSTDDTRTRAAIQPGSMKFYSPDSTYGYGLTARESADYSEVVLEGQWDGAPSAPRIRLQQNWSLGERVVNVEAERLYIAGNTGDNLAGAWRSYSPTLYNGATQVAKVTAYAKYMRMGNTVWASVRLEAAAAGPAGNILITLPVTAAASSLAIGQMFFYDFSANTGYFGTAFSASTTQVMCIRDSSLGNAAIATALAAGDVVWFTVTYEAA